MAKTVCYTDKVSAIRGCSSIEVNWRTVGTFRIVRCVVGVRVIPLSSNCGVNTTSTIISLKWNDLLINVLYTLEY